MVNNYISGLPLIGMTRGRFWVWREGPHFKPTFHHTHVGEDATLLLRGKSFDA
jgi:hypothetical protein